MLTLAEIQSRLSNRVVYEVYPITELQLTRLRHIDRTLPCKCVTCGLEGAFILKNRHIGEVAKDQYLKQKHGYHYDAYGILPDGTLRALTLDHILPVSKGGTNRSTNHQIMCAHCNHVVKSSRLTSEDWVRIMKRPTDFISTSPEKGKRFIKAMLRDLGIDMAQMIRRQQDVLEATGQLCSKPYWTKLFPSTLVEPGNDS